MGSDPPSPHPPPRRGDGDFGPGGFLPQRAADRARKIVLRERMALSWPIAAVLAGLVVLGAGTAFLLRGGAPGEPYTALAELTELGDGDTAVAATPGGDVLLVRAGGTVRAFIAPDRAVSWCGETRRLQGAAGGVWRLDGRRVGGDAASLRPVPSEVHAGTVYAAPARAGPRPPSAGRGETPGCETP